MKSCPPVLLATLLPQCPKARKDVTWSYISLATSMDLAEPRRRKQPIKNSCESGKDGENMEKLKGQVGSIWFPLSFAG